MTDPDDDVSDLEFMFASMLIGVTSGVIVIGLLTFGAWAFGLVHLTRAF